MLLLKIGLELGLESDQIRGLGFRKVIQGHLENKLKNHVTVKCRMINHHPRHTLHATFRARRRISLIFGIRNMYQHHSKTTSFAPFSLTIVNGLVRRALLRTSCLGLIFREESGARYFEEIQTSSIRQHFYHQINSYLHVHQIFRTVHSCEIPIGRSSQIFKMISLISRNRRYIQLIVIVIGQKSSNFVKLHEFQTYFCSQSSAPPILAPGPLGETH